MSEAVTRSVFDPRPEHVELMVDEVSVEQGFLGVPLFSPDNITPPVVHN